MKKVLLLLLVLSATAFGQFNPHSVIVPTYAPNSLGAMRISSGQLNFYNGSSWLAIPLGVTGGAGGFSYFTLTGGAYNTNLTQKLSLRGFAGDTTGTGKLNIYSVGQPYFIQMYNWDHSDSLGVDTSGISNFRRPNVLMVGTHQQYTSVQAAVTAASAGQTVEVYPGTYTESVVLKNRVNLYFYPGAIVRWGGSDSANTIGDNGVADTVVIGGSGKFVRYGTPTAYNGGMTVLAKNAASVIRIDYDEVLDSATTGSDAIGVIGGTIYGYGKRAISYNNAGLYANGGMLTIVGEIVSYGHQGVFAIGGAEVYHWGRTLSYSTLAGNAGIYASDANTKVWNYGSSYSNAGPGDYALAGAKIYHVGNATTVANAVGALAGGTNSFVEVHGDVTEKPTSGLGSAGSERGIQATSGGTVHVYGNVTCWASYNSSYAVEVDLNSNALVVGDIYDTSAACIVTKSGTFVGKGTVTNGSTLTNNYSNAIIVSGGTVTFSGAVIGRYYGIRADSGTAIINGSVKSTVCSALYTTNALSTINVHGPVSSTYRGPVVYPTAGKITVHGDITSNPTSSYGSAGADRCVQAVTGGTATIFGNAYNWGATNSSYVLECDMNSTINFTGTAYDTVTAVIYSTGGTINFSGTAINGHAGSNQNYCNAIRNNGGTINFSGTATAPYNGLWASGAGTTWFRSAQIISTLYVPVNVASASAVVRFTGSQISATKNASNNHGITMSAAGSVILSGTVIYVADINNKSIYSSSVADTVLVYGATASNRVCDAALVFPVDTIAVNMAVK